MAYASAGRSSIVLALMLATTLPAGASEALLGKLYGVPRDDRQAHRYQEAPLSYDAT
jgi:hypothetical protein